PGVGCEIPSTACGLPPAAGAYIKIARKDDPAKDRLQWKWRNATPLDVTDFGVPGDTRYRFCLYDGAGNVAVSIGTDGACGSSASCWTAKPKGWAYKDGKATIDGLRAIGLAAGVAGKGKLTVAGKGAGL